MSVVRRPFALASVTAAIAVACASVPNVTFQDADGSAGGDGATGPDAMNAGGMSSFDGAASSEGGARDSGSSNTDSGNPCGAGPGDVCCGKQLCKGCSVSNCGACTAMQCEDNNGDICCLRGNKIKCGPIQGC